MAKETYISKLKVKHSTVYAETNCKLFFREQITGT